MRLAQSAAIAAIFLSAGSAPAHAQSFLEGLARRAVDRVADEASRRVERAVEDAASGAAVEESSGSSLAVAPVAASAGNSGATRPAAPPRGPAPWPINPDDAAYTGDLEFDPADEARASGLDEFAKVDCMDCEGGYSYDSWINYHTDMDVDGVAARVGELSIGETLSWTGIEASGVLEVISETPVGSFPCKQVRLVMTRGEATYETPGLYCFGKSHQYAKAMWVEVL